MRSPRRLAVLLAFVVVTAVGCKATANVGIDVAANGSGTVTVSLVLDREATEQLGGDAAGAIRTDDLEAAGWKVTGPTINDGRLDLSLRKDFATASQLGPLLDQLGGPSGPFAGWKLATDDSFTESTYDVTGTVGLTGAVDQFSDADVAAALDGLPVGRTAEELAAALKADPGALTLGVEVRLPGELDTVRGLGQQDPDTPVAARTFVIADGSASKVGVEVTSVRSDRSSVVWLIMGVVLIVLAGVVLLSGRSRKSRPKRPSDPSSVPASPPAE